MDKKEILDLINNEIRNEFLAKKISDIRYHYLTECQNYNYDGLYVMEFLALYKIDKLEKLNIIPKEIANNLRELLDLKLKYQDMLRTEIIKTINHNTDKYLLDQITSKIIMIDDELEKYHILPLIEDLDFVMESIVKNEDYNIKGSAHQFALIKVLKNN